MDPAQLFYTAETIFLAKVININVTSTHSLVTVRVRRVIRDLEPGTDKPRTVKIKKNYKVVISYNSTLCIKVSAKSKYIFSGHAHQFKGTSGLDNISIEDDIYKTHLFSSDEKIVKGLDSPVKNSKKVQTIIHKMFCKSCSTFPSVRPVKSQYTVNMNRYL